MIIYFLIGLATIYAIGLFIVAFYWTKIPVESPTEIKYTGRVSLIIPFRNEEKSVVNIINDLKIFNSNIPDEVIFVNDHSNDMSMSILQEALNEIPNCKVVSLSSSHGKKAAILEGINNATGDLLLLTDADCRLKNNWADHLVNGFDKSTIFVYGPVGYNSNGSLLSELQQLELIILQVFSGATWAMGFPTMCNGANIGYRKSAFDAIDGFQSNMHIPSGDDEFIMHQFYSKNPHCIRYIKPAEPEVLTNTENDLTLFLNQRKRWAGKWKSYNHMPSTLLGFFIFIYNVFFVLILVAGFFELCNWEWVLTIFGLKGISEWWLLHTGSNYFKAKIGLFPFFILLFFYPFYVVIFGTLSQFGSYNWKKRKFRNG